MVEREADGGCWVWRGAQTSTGYGMLQRGGRGEGTIRAHRLAYELHHGPIPLGLLVLHSCNNKLCVNPAHLSLGDHSENISQAWRDGLRPAPRNAIRETARKLEERDVREIRRLRAEGWKLRPLAERFGVLPCTISSIALRKTWAHI